MLARRLAPVSWTTGLQYRLMFVLWAILAAVVPFDTTERELEEGLWATRLPATFNQKHSRESHRLTFAPRSVAR